jgi:hypothetical protein
VKNQQSQIVARTPEEAAPQIAALGHEVVTLREQNSAPFMGSDGEWRCGQCGAPVDGGGVFREPERA